MPDSCGPFSQHAEPPEREEHAHLLAHRCGSGRDDERRQDAVQITGEDDEADAILRRALLERGDAPLQLPKLVVRQAVRFT